MESDALRSAKANVPHVGPAPTRHFAEMEQMEQMDIVGEPVDTTIPSR